MIDHGMACRVPVGTITSGRSPMGRASGWTTSSSSRATAWSVAPCAARREALDVVACARRRSPKRRASSSARTSAARPSSCKRARRSASVTACRVPSTSKYATSAPSPRSASSSENERGPAVAAVIPGVRRVRSRIDFSSVACRAWSLRGSLPPSTASWSSALAPRSSASSAANSALSGGRTGRSRSAAARHSSDQPSARRGSASSRANLSPDCASSSAWPLTCALNSVAPRTARKSWTSRAPARRAVYASRRCPSAIATRAAACFARTRRSTGSRRLTRTRARAFRAARVWPRARAMRALSRRASRAATVQPASPSEPAARCAARRRLADGPCSRKDARRAV